MHVAIIGAEGYVGQRLVEKLILCGHEVTSITRTTSIRTQGPHARLSTNEFLSCTSDNRHHFEAVVNVAQSSNTGNSVARSADIIDTNTVLPLRILDVCQTLGVTRLIHFSSGGVYRRVGTVIDESSQYEYLDDLDLYLKSKLLADYELQKNLRENIKLTTVRPFFVYGPGTSPNRLIGRIIEKLRNQSLIHISGPDGILLNPCHVDDLVVATCSLLDDDQEAVINMAGSDVVSLGELVRDIAARLDLAAHVEITSERDMDCIADVALFSRLLKRQPRGIRDLSFLSMM
jgi:nucleoside-diphosphate-sugar epimerase